MINMGKTTVVDRFEPDFKTKCMVCDQSPTVTGVADGKVVVETEMCGPCTWGEAAMLDWKKWND